MRKRGAFSHFIYIVYILSCWKPIAKQLYMKHLYCLLLLNLLLSGLAAQGQNWRPFRPNGDVHAFRGASVDTVLTLRLDSAGVTGTDSVYYFNRIMRRAGSFAWQKSRNNQFGQQMRYNTAQRTYALFWNGGSTIGLILDYLLVLKPFAPLGETWPSGFTDYGVATTLVSRGTMLLDGVQDSVATFQTQFGATIVLSKNFGLVSAPADLLFGVPITAPNFNMLTLARRPAPAGLSYYNPLTLLDLQPGDELGYDYRQFNSSPINCATGTILRRVLTRQLTADSLIYTLEEQSRIVYNGPSGCANTGTVVSPVEVVRLGASRRTGRWQWRNPVMIPLSSPLLAYGYQPLYTGSNDVLLGYPVVATRPGAACGGSASLLLEVLYRSTTGYSPGLDVRNRQDFSAQGVGAVKQLEHELVYTRRTINGAVQTCGNRTNFATLLPTKATQRAAMFQLYPNPAAESVTLTLPEAARVGTVVRVLDALGRAVVRHPLTGGQTTAVLPLAGLTAGVYLVEVQATGEAPQRLRLQRQ